MSLGLGVWNFFAARSIRRGTITLDELRSQFRDPIHEKLDSLGEVRSEYLALNRPNGLKVGELREKVGDSTAKLEFSVLDLEALLVLADRSTFTKGVDWESSFQRALDDIRADAGNLTLPDVDLKALGAGLSSITMRIDALNRELRKRLEIEVRLHLPR